MLKSTIYALLATLVALSEATTSLGCYLAVSIAETKGDYTFQSPSYCQQQCSDYAYIALMAGDVCYCLSSFPSGDTTSGCNTACFGYGLDTCGGSKVYDVYAGTGTQGALTAAALGSSASLTTLSTSTKSSSSSSSSSSSASSSSSLESTSTSLHAATSASSSSAAASSSDASSSLALGASTASVTATSTVTSTATPSSSSKKSTNVGPIVGGVVGGVAALALIAVAGFFLVRRMRDDEDEDDEYFEPKAVSRGTLKKKPNALDMPLQNPLNPFAHPSDAISGQGGLTDPRLNLTMMGRKRLLEGTLADETDYSRKILQVINPDH